MIWCYLALMQATRSMDADELRRDRDLAYALQADGIYTPTPMDEALRNE
jgi:hypothetical protein